ncbi:hypothetical protein HGA64_01685 [Candidatus Falkowbacteria bacterium]|nr:hypothetical protein [Candidatus Falkowbacteria bacterium]
MAFRKMYWPLVEAGILTKVFRPGKRQCGDFRGYCKGQRVTARRIERIGADWFGVPPIFSEGCERDVEIVSVVVKRIGDLSKADFVGSSPDVRDVKSLRYHLGMIYNLSPEEVGRNSNVTIITFNYFNEETRMENKLPIDQLLEEGVLQFASHPPHNPKTLSFRRLAITLLEDDYPAKTPIMWNTTYEALGIECTSVALVVKEHDLAKIAEALRSDQRYIGGGLGVGLKDDMLPFLDHLDQSAASVNASNIVIKQQDGGLKGYNTDGMGFVAGLNRHYAERSESLLGKNVLLLGSGGTANAIAFKLAGAGVKLVIANRTLSKAENLAASINELYGASEREPVRFCPEAEIIDIIGTSDIVINSTTKGAVGPYSCYSALAPAVLPASAENLAENHRQAAEILRQIKQGALVVDVVLRNEDTPLLASAKAIGLQTMNGIPMVLNQGVEAFSIMHGNELLSLGKTKKEVASFMAKAAGFSE